MKESRFLTIVFLAVFVLLGPILYGVYCIKPDLIDYMNVGTNLYCGVIVALITSICQYYTSKKRIVNTIYNAYFDLYRTFYYVKSNPNLGHYNSLNMSNKLAEIGEKISESVDEYHGFWKKQDKLYKKINQLSGLESKDFNLNTIIKSLRKLFNKDSFYESFEPLINMSEEILVSINKERFENDKKNLIKIFNILLEISDNNKS